MTFDGDPASDLSRRGYLTMRLSTPTLDLLTRAYSAWAEVFDSAKKFNYERDPKNSNGYVPIRLKNGREMKESFYCNPWTALPPVTEAVTRQLVGQLGEVVHAVSDVIHHAFGAGLILSKGVGCLRVMRYPAFKGEPDSEIVSALAEHGALRAPLHTDLNALTILPPPTAPGLEILDESGQWNLEDTIPNRLIVQVGQELERRSEARLHACVHRVRNPNASEINLSRMSMAMFVS